MCRGPPFRSGAWCSPNSNWLRIEAKIIGDAKKGTRTAHEMVMWSSRLRAASLWKALIKSSPSDDAIDIIQRILIPTHILFTIQTYLNPVGINCILSAHHIFYEKWKMIPPAIWRVPDAVKPVIYDMPLLNPAFSFVAEQSFYYKLPRNVKCNSIQIRIECLYFEKCLERGHIMTAESWFTYSVIKWNQNDNLFNFFLLL